QFLVIRRHVRINGGARTWLLLSVLGALLAVTILDLVSLAFSKIAAMDSASFLGWLLEWVSLLGAIGLLLGFGALIGWAQWLLLRRYSSRAYLWIIAYALLGAVSFSLVEIFAEPLDRLTVILGGGMTDFFCAPSCQ